MAELIEILRKENDTQRAQISELLTELENKRSTGQGIDAGAAYIQISRIGQRICDLYDVSLMLAAGQ